jgi:ABC-type lipoprotein release transport system permease subunit
MLLALAWRNVWRNARRSLITMSALSLGVAGIVGIFSYREVANEAIVSDITSGLMGHLQVHARGYQDAPAVGLVVEHPLQVEATLRAALPGAKSERRVLGAGLAGSKDHASPVVVVGVEPGASSLYQLVSGKDLGGNKDVLVGKDLARDLELSPGSELVLVSQGADGSVANDRYTVSGAFTSSSAELDGNAVVLSLAEAQSFFALGDGVHQLVVRLPTLKEDVTPEAELLRGALDMKTLEALSCSEMLPQMKSSIESKRKSQRLIDFIIFLIVGLGVFNAMAMAVFERTRELGVMGALGTRPRRILAMVMAESLWQGLLGFLVGVGISAAVLYGIGTVDLGAQMGGDVLGVKMPTQLVLRLFPDSLVSAGVTAFLTALLGALLPAVRAMRLQPVEALRHT